MDGIYSTPYPTSPLLDGQYELITELGKGGQGIVFLVRDIADQKLYAAKIVKPDLKMTESQRDELLRRESTSHQEISCDHPNIVRSIRVKFAGEDITQSEEDSDLCRDSNQLDVSYHLLEYATNETVLTYFKQSGGFKEHVTQFFFLQMAAAVNHIHSRGYAHLDIKLNNIFLDEYFNIKIGDFGSALRPQKNGKTNKRRGTTNYMAPEVKNQKQDTTDGSRKVKTYDPFRADVYSLGVCLFILLFKSYPKLKSSTEASPDSVKTPTEFPTFLDSLTLPNPFTISDSKWESKSVEARRLVVRMLQEDPSKRPTIGEVYDSDWLLQYTPGVENHVFKEMDRVRQRLPQKPQDTSSLSLLLRKMGDDQNNRTQTTGAESPKRYMKGYNCPGMNDYDHFRISL